MFFVKFLIEHSLDRYFRQLPNSKRSLRGLFGGCLDPLVNIELEGTKQSIMMMTDLIYLELCI